MVTSVKAFRAVDILADFQAISNQSNSKQLSKNKTHSIKRALVVELKTRSLHAMRMFSDQYPRRKASRGKTASISKSRARRTMRAGGASADLGRRDSAKRSNSATPSCPLPAVASNTLIIRGPFVGSTDASSTAMLSCDTGRGTRAERRAGEGLGIVIIDCGGVASVAKECAGAGVVTMVTMSAGAGVATALVVESDGAGVVNVVIDLADAGVVTALSAESAGAGVVNAVIDLAGAGVATALVVESAGAGVVNAVTVLAGAGVVTALGA